MWVLPLLWACASERVGPTVDWGLRGDGAVGVLRAAGGGCDDAGPTIALYGPTWSTGGAVGAEIVEEEPGVLWVWFPIRTGLGEGEAALRVQGDEARLPLGARRGEFDVVLRREDAIPDVDALEVAREAAEAALAQEEAAWTAGTFLLMDGERVVGDVALGGEDGPVVAVYDAQWLTPEPVVARISSDGADLLLAFAAEPTLRGEDSLLRINAPLRRAVVPADSAPTEVDRALRLAPGTVSAEEREGLIAGARAAGLALEAEATASLARQAAIASRAPDGTCRPLEALDPAWTMLFEGYRVVIASDSAGRCAVELEPRMPQHGRSWRGRVTAAGVAGDDGLQ